MNLILAIPLGIRLLALFGLGAVVGGFINLAIYRLAWNQRSISPWSPPPAGCARRWSDRLPIFGWLAVRRESSLWGRGFWLRPWGVEIVTGLLFAGLYYWETQWAAPRPMLPFGVLPAADFLAANLPLVLHVRYASHLIVMSLMIVASLIDIDEKTIPDTITVAGTLVALALAALYPWSLLPAADWIVGGAQHVEFLTLVSPNPWPAALGGLPLWEPLAVALGCWTLWCGGLLPRRWNLRHGLTTAVRVFCHRLRVEPITYRILAMWLAGTAAIALVAWLAPAPNWAGLLTALVGMAGGGGVIWTVRIIGGATLRREAMGFGDVTLLAMIGAFVGWQAALIIFFVAPMAGLVIGLAQWIFHGEHEIPYGPFLCLAAFGVILNWTDIWDRTSDIFSLGWMLVILLAVCMVLMAAMLLGFRLVRDRAVPPR